MSVETAAEVPQHVREYLRQHSTMTLATATPSGVPHAASMVYAGDGPALYFCTRPDTTTARHIEQNPVVSFTVDDYSADWQQMKGIQGAGEAYVVLSASAISDVTSLFKEKFPALQDLDTRNVSIFRVVPRSLEYLDNGQAGSEQGIQSLTRDWRRTMVYNIFRELPNRQFEDVMGKLDTIRADTGDTVVRQGAPADKFFIIAEGSVEVLRDQDGQVHKVADLGAGQFFGEMAVLRDLPRTATVRATAPTTLLAMPGDVFRSLVAQSLATTADFDELMRRRFAELNELGGPTS